MAKLRKRLDTFLTEKGYFETRNLAQAAIMEGRILVNGQKVEKAGFNIGDDYTIRVLGEDQPYVSRGGLKLQAAIEHFQIDVTGKICLDIGASTGGFTDCLIQNGAEKVIALDVGKGLIHNKLRQDTRVEIIENVNARYITENQFSEQFDIITIDVSFISQRLVIPSLKQHLKSGGTVIALIKPQFEAGRELVGKGGIVRDGSVRENVVEEIRAFYIDNGFDLVGIIESPITGTDGNIEFLIVAKYIAI